MAESSSPSSTKVDDFKTTREDTVENLLDSSFIKTSQQSGVQNSSSTENHKDVRQQAPPQEEVVKDIVDTPSAKLIESRQESSTREGDTRTSMTEVFKKLDDVTASMQLLAVDLQGIEYIVDESTLGDRISKFQDDIQCSSKEIIKMLQVGARSVKQDDEVKNHESHATVLDQHIGSNMITNQTQDYIKNIDLSSTTVAEPCVFTHQNLEVEGCISKTMLQEGVSNKQGLLQDEAGIIDPESSVDEDHDKQHRDREEPPQEEKTQDGPSQENVETPRSPSQGSKIMQQEGVCNKQCPPQDVDHDEVKDPSVKRVQEYDLQFPSLHPCKGLSQEKMIDGDRLQENFKAEHDDAAEKKKMHKDDLKQSPEIIAEICKREVAVVGTYEAKNRFSLGEYFTFTKTTGSKKAKKKPQKC